MKMILALIDPVSIRINLAIAITLVAGGVFVRLAVEMILGIYHAKGLVLFAE